MAKKKQITVQRLLYLNQRRREECSEPYSPYSNIKEFVEELIMSELPLEIDNSDLLHYDAKKWHPNYKLENVRKDTFSSTDWSGLRKLLPYLGDTRNVPVLMTIVFNSNEVSEYPEEYQTDKYERPDDYNFHAQDTFWAISHRYKNWMMSRKENMIDWEVEDGYIKYDVLNRDDGVLVFEYGPLSEFLPDSRNDGDHGTEKPFEMQIFIDAQL